MESVGTLFEGEWSSISGMFSTEEADCMAQLLSNWPFQNDDEITSFGASSTLRPSHDAITNMAMGDDSSYYCSDTINSNSYYFPQGSNYSSGNTSSLFFPTLGQENFLSDSNPILPMNDSSMSMPMDFCVAGWQNPSLSVQVFPNNLMEEAVCLNEERSTEIFGESGGNPPEAVFPADNKLQSKRKSAIRELVVAAEDKNQINPLENPKKKIRVSGDVQRNKRNSQSKKNQKLAAPTTNDDEEESNAGLNGQSSSSYSSEDDSNASQELNGGVTSNSKGSSALNLNGKTRASRGSATDSQSLYARKRRERINERLRILQNLVPNGTKVDISTMLEEAVQYVKFLQQQIKLLSSDDLWMYAPIAYNGMNIGLDLKISPP